MGNVPDSYSQFVAYEQEEEPLPDCCECGRKISGDDIWDIGGDLYCDHCAKENFRMSLDEWLDAHEA